MSHEEDEDEEEYYDEDEFTSGRPVFHFGREQAHPLPGGRRRHFSRHGAASPDSEDEESGPGVSMSLPNRRFNTQAGGAPLRAEPVRPAGIPRTSTSRF